MGLKKEVNVKKTLNVKKKLNVKKNVFNFRLIKHRNGCQGVEEVCSRAPQKKISHYLPGV